MDVFLTNLVECYTHLRGIVIHWATGGVALAFFILIVLATYLDERSYALIRKIIIRAKWREIYFGFLERAQTKLDGFYGPFNLRGILTQSSERTLDLALFYPFLFMFLAWLIGGPGTISGLSVFVTVDNPIDRLIVTSGMTLAVAISYVAMRYLYNLSLSEKVFSKVMPGWIADVSAAILIIASVPLSMAVGMGTSELFSIFELSVRYQHGFILYNTFEFTALGGTFGIAAVAALFVMWVLNGELRGWVIVCILLVMLAHGLILNDPSNVGLMVVGGFLIVPTANALLDWVSVNASRWLLHDLVRRGQKTGSLIIAWHGAVDIVVAAVSLVGLALVLPTVIAGYNRLLSGFGMPIFQWRPFLDAAQSDTPFAGFAVIGMLFTTLAPTILHLLALVAIFLVPRGPGFGRQAFRNMLVAPNPPDVLKLVVIGWFAIAVLGSISIVIAVGCVAYAAFESGLHLVFGRNLAELAIWVSQSLGDPVWNSSQ